MTNNDTDRRNFCELNANAIGIDNKPFIVCEAENENEAFCPLGRGGWLAPFGEPFALNETQATAIVNELKSRGKDVKMVSKISWSKNQLAAAR